MTLEIRHRLKVETERLGDLEEQLAFASYHAICRDGEASADRNAEADDPGIGGGSLMYEQKLPAAPAAELNAYTE
jgi:hypothetical protein